MTETRHCSRHGIGYSVEEKNILGTLVMVGVCPDCEAEQVADLASKMSMRLASQNARCRIEPMYHEATLGSYEITTDEQRRAVTAVQRLIESGSGKLVMMGVNGTGKTHLAVAAVRTLNGQIWSMYEITMRIRASYSHAESENEAQILDELARLPMLAIDEIGRTKGSDAESNWLSYIVDKRHVRHLPLILVTNKHIRKDCQKYGCQNCLENYIGDDIMSRLNEGGLMIRFAGRDYRRIKK